MSEETARPERETFIRARPAIEFRDAGDTDLGNGYLGLLRILFSPVNEWAEIRSAWEGNFMERFAPGAWKKTIRENADRIRSLFQHGMDPQIGDKPLGPFRLLEENDRGGYAEVALLDTSYNRDLLPGLKDGLYGASHRFSVMREEVVQNPEPSDHNPNGIPERTVKESGLRELGPVTFPAYAGATAGMRSLTDDFLMRCFDQDRDKLRAMFDQHVTLENLKDAAHSAVQQDTAPSEDDAESESHPVEDEDRAETDDSHLADERRETDAARRGPRDHIYGTRRKETSKPWLL